jgi:hypothetical protein
MSSGKSCLGIVAICFPEKDRPRNYVQFWDWIKKALPGGEEVVMLGLATICWSLWKARNKACFTKKQSKHPGEIIYAACSFMHYLAGLYPEESEKAISSCVDMMIKTALRLLGREGGVAKALKNAEDKKDDDHADGRQDAHRVMEMLETEGLTKAGSLCHTDGRSFCYYVSRLGGCVPGSEVVLGQVWNDQVLLARFFVFP